MPRRAPIHGISKSRDHIFIWPPPIKPRLRRDYNGARTVLRHIRVTSNHGHKQGIMAGYDANRHPVIDTRSYKLTGGACYDSNHGRCANLATHVYRDFSIASSSNTIRDGITDQLREFALSFPAKSSVL